MNRFILNLLAGATILVGGGVLLFPASASANPDEACCKVTITNADGSKIERECCGDRCDIDSANQCSACTGLECLH